MTRKGRELVVNARGCVEVLDDRGSPIPGYTKEECDTFCGDAVGVYFRFSPDGGVQFSEGPHGI
ncbi:MAG: hypothetical protein DRP99_02290 [Candidatus Latescibacterota bacterium]|nr:MAG: hypothetical protein DRP99_02290 [Candidatus Latescibacterota bacterium]